MNEKECFRRTLKSLRLEAGLSQKQLAEKLDLTRGAISHWENGLREPGLHELTVIAKFFHVSIDYLAGLED